MRRITHRELRNNSAQILREVEAGETMEITNNGRVVAMLAPPKLRLPVTITPARKPGDVRKLKLVRVRGDGQKILREDRDAR